jgi:hypothetical protein
MPIDPGHTVEPNGCWRWNGYVNPTTGRAGQVSFGGGRLGSAYQRYYERAKGPIPAGLQIDHLCRNPRCVNPDHLEAVTSAVNTRRGAAAKLDEVDVFIIRASVLAGGESRHAVGKRFGLSRAYVGMICSRQRWAS